jgi:hypothetical protein
LHRLGACSKPNRTIKNHFGGCPYAPGATGNIVCRAPCPLEGVRVVYLSHMLMGPTCGLEFATQLVRESDVLLENFGAGVLDRLGLGYDAMQELSDSKGMPSPSFKLRIVSMDNPRFPFNTSD